MHGEGDGRTRESSAQERSGKARRRTNKSAKSTRYAWPIAALLVLALAVAGILIRRVEMAPCGVQCLEVALRQRGTQVDESVMNAAIKALESGTIDLRRSVSHDATYRALADQTLLGMIETCAASCRDVDRQLTIQAASARVHVREIWEGTRRDVAAATVQSDTGARCTSDARGMCELLLQQVGISQTLQLRAEHAGRDVSKIVPMGDVIGGELELLLPPPSRAVETHAPEGVGSSPRAVTKRAREPAAIPRADDGERKGGGNHVSVGNIVTHGPNSPVIPAGGDVTVNAPPVTAPLAAPEEKR